MIDEPVLACQSLIIQWEADSPVSVTELDETELS